MSATTVAYPSQSLRSTPKSFWLRDAKWDLAFITLSVVLVPLPYLFYLLGVRFGVDADVSRNVVNGFVAVAVGGPHMMSTMLRTGLDNSFKRNYPILVRSSVIIPMVVIALAFLNLNLLLTIFFFWASLHVLHQVSYIVELYNHKEEHFVRPHSTVSPLARLIDYSVIMTCLFPVASYKISKGTFDIGSNDLTASIPTFFQQTWFFVAMTSLFTIAISAFAMKSYYEYRGGYINWPKTIFIMLTVMVAASVPALPNLDTAFQGMNTWHSFQYLAITFYIIKLRQKYGSLDNDAPLVARFSKGENSRGLFALSTMMLVGSAAVFALVYGFIAIFLPNMESNKHFDTAYYTSVLSFLWIHYYHDHFLFTNFEALDIAYEK